MCLTSIINNIDAESIKNISEILFWIGMFSLAVLTYRQANKTFLSPVNTDYQKRVFDVLSVVNDKLFSELNMGSENYWLYKTPMSRALEEMCKEYADNKESVLKYGLDLDTYPASDEWQKMSSLSDEIRYELFIPGSIKEVINSYLDERAEACQEAHNYAMIEFVEDINKRRAFDEITEDNIEIENLYMEKIAELGFGVDDIHERNAKIQRLIVDYVQSFNPLK